VVQTFVHEFDLTVDQVKLNPSMDVSDSTSLHLPLNMVSARRAQCSAGIEGGRPVQGV
jgi:hypothetical protein